MELYEHIFYTYAQAAAHHQPLDDARHVHVNALSLTAGAAVSLLNDIAAVLFKKEDFLTATYHDYVAGKIDKAYCLSLFKKYTMEVMNYG